MPVLAGNQLIISFLLAGFWLLPEVIEFSFEKLSTPLWSIIWELSLSSPRFSSRILPIFCDANSWKLQLKSGNPKLSVWKSTNSTCCKKNYSCAALSIRLSRWLVDKSQQVLSKAFIAAYTSWIWYMPQPLTLYLSFWIS